MYMFVVKIFYRKFLNFVYIEWQEGPHAAHCAAHNFRYSNAHNCGTKTAMKIRFSPKWRSGTAVLALVSSVSYYTPS